MISFRSGTAVSRGGKRSLTVAARIVSLTLRDFLSEPRPLGSGLTCEDRVSRQTLIIEVAIPGVALQRGQSRGRQCAQVAQSGVRFHMAPRTHAGDDAGNGRVRQAEAECGIGQAGTFAEVAAQRVDVLHHLSLALGAAEIV